MVCRRCDQGITADTGFDQADNASGDAGHRLIFAQTYHRVRVQYSDLECSTCGSWKLRQITKAKQY